MSLSVESLALRCKRTATDRAKNNGDPLVIKKKACGAARSNPAVKKRPSLTNVCRHSPESIHMEDLPDRGSTATSKQPANPCCCSSVHMEEIDNEEDFPCNVAPINKVCIIELSNGSNNDDLPPLVPDDNNKDDKDKDKDEAPKESEEAEFEHLSKDWNSPVYAFFKPSASVVYIDNRRVHVFECSATCCMGGCMVRCYLDTGDTKSTSNLRKHAKICWEEDIVGDANKTKDVHAACEALAKIKSANGSITDAFE
ncbi:hypothetical protein B0H34DRAFT_825183 [Crassisporium funariophilum]|nr:hypothetical protein B0H34DRAFT_825183 [Crassisporium funariophilum]